MGGGRSRPRKRPGPRACTGRRPRRWLLARNSPGARRLANCLSTRPTGSRYRRRKPTSRVLAASRESLLVYVPPRVGHRVSVVQKREKGTQVARNSREDKNEGTMDRAKGRMKEAGGALTGDKSKKREGRSDQRKGRAKEKKGDLKDLLS